MAALRTELLTNVLPPCFLRHLGTNCLAMTFSWLSSLLCFKSSSWWIFLLLAPLLINPVHYLKTYYYIVWKCCQTSNMHTSCDFLCAHYLFHFLDLWCSGSSDATVFFILFLVLFPWLSCDSLSRNFSGRVEFHYLYYFNRCEKIEGWILGHHNKFWGLVGLGK